MQGIGGPGVQIKSSLFSQTERVEGPPGNRSEMMPLKRGRSWARNLGTLTSLRGAWAPW
jgi:hypothetical protein